MVAEVFIRKVFSAHLGGKSGIIEEGVCLHVCVCACVCVGAFWVKN